MTNNGGGVVNKWGFFDPSANYARLKFLSHRYGSSHSKAFSQKKKFWDFEKTIANCLKSRQNPDRYGTCHSKAYSQKKSFGILIKQQQIAWNPGKILENNCEGTLFSPTQVFSRILPKSLVHLFPRTALYGNSGY